MVDDLSPRLSDVAIRNINKSFICWARFMPYEGIESQKPHVYEDAEKRLSEKGTDITTLNLEWVVIYHPSGGPIDQSVLLGLKEVDAHG